MALPTGWPLVLFIFGRASSALHWEKNDPLLSTREDEGTILGLAFQHSSTEFHGPE